MFSGELIAEGFNINRADAEFNNSALSVKATLDLELSDAVSEALHNGVTIELITTLDLFKKRRFLWSDRIAQWRFNYQISFHSLTNRYVLTQPQYNESQSYTALGALLKQIETFDFESEIMGDTLPPGKHGYKLKLRVALNKAALPAPLRVMSHVLPDWWLKSDTFEWFVKA